jgi:DNA-directed RNA polymerase alpha subunit
LEIGKGGTVSKANLAERTVAWAEAEIDDWLAARMAERDGIPTAPINIDELGLSVRTRNCLKNLHINSLGDLIQKTEAELLRQPNFGRTSLAEIKQTLAQRGLHLREGFARP